MKNWTKKDFTIKWEWHRSRLQNGSNGYYVIVWQNKGRLSDNKHRDYRFHTKREAEQWLGAFLKQANALRKQAHAQGRI